MSEMHDIAAEVSVLGAVLIAPEWLAPLRAKLTAADFSSPAHGAIWEACCSVADDGMKCDLATVGERLKRNRKADEVGGLSYLAQLADAVPSPANCESYARIVKRHSRRRAIFNALNAASRRVECGTDEPESIAADAAKQMADAATSQEVKSVTLVSALADWDVTQAQEFLSTGLPLLDHCLCGGTQRGRCVIIGARPGMGKTSMLLQILAGMAGAGLRCGFLSGEMGVEEMRVLMLGQQARIPITTVRRGIPRALQQQAADAMARMAELPIFLSEFGGMNADTFPGVAESFVLRDKLDVLALDYMQLLGRGQDIRGQVSDVARTLKNLALSRNIVTIGVSAITRSGKESDTTKPTISLLKESGEIEHAADQVILLWFPNGKDPQGNGTIQLVAAKNRLGPTGFIDAAWVGRYQRVEESGNE